MDRIDEIVNYLCFKIYPKRFDKCEWKRRNFRRDCRNYRMDGDVLYKKCKRRDKRVIDENMFARVFKDTHTAPHGGHLGVNKTYVKINERYYCKGLFNKVRKFVEVCDACQKKGSLKKAKKPLHPIPVSNVAFSKIRMDLIGPLEESEDGNKYILVFTEYLTKWVEAEAVLDKKAETILKPFIKFVCTHGMPDTLITDQGREFCNQLNEMFCKKMGIQHNVASPYHPQTGGHTERFNRTLSSMLVSYVNGNCNDWDSKLPYVLFAYRTAEHSTTKQDPFFLVYGRKARLPIELELPMACNNERVNTFLKLKDYREDAAQKIKKGQAKQKKHYDSKITKSIFNIGDEVLLHNTRKLTRKGGKLNPLWSGPHIVQTVLDNDCYRLNGNKVAVNGNRLKAYGRNDSNQEIKKESLNASTNNTNDVKEDELEMNEPCENRSANDAKKPANTTESNKDNQDANEVAHTELKQTRAENEKSHEHSKQTTGISDQNKSDRSLPLKKRRKYEPEAMSDDITLLKVETNDNILFYPVERTWQDDKSSMFGKAVKNHHKRIRSRPVSRDARPVNVARMRGDGNCLFRAFSYLIFGVQTYYAEIRQRIIDFMIRHSAIFEDYVDESLTTYLNISRMWDDGRWGTDVEIRALATMLNTNVFVYCKFGEDGSYKWIEYTPIGSISDSFIYIWHRNGDHYEPVLDVEDEFDKTPYMPIRKYVPHNYWKDVTLETLEGALVDNYGDEDQLQNMCPEIKCIYVHTYTDKHYQILGTEAVAKQMDCNIFNILCDHESFADKVSANH